MPPLNRFTRSLFAAAGLCLGAGVQATPAGNADAPADPRPVLATYAELAYRAYAEAYEDVLHLQAAVDEFVGAPADDAEGSLNRVRQAWLDSRASYGRAEAF